MKNNVIRVAMIGAGGIGKTHITNMRGMKDVVISDICSQGQEGMELARELGAAYYSDHRQMLKNTSADIVMVCTPSYMHVGHTRDVLLAGIHCICEKPLCFSSKEAEALYQLAEDKGVQLYVAHVMLFWEEYALLSRIVQEQKYGKVLDASFQRLSQRPGWSSSNWILDPQKSGALPFDLHVHDVYFAISLFGKPKVAYVQRGGNKGLSYDEYLRVCYEFGDVTVVAEASWYAAPMPFTMGFRVYFERAVLVFDGKSLFVYEVDQEPQELLMQGSAQALKTSVNVGATSAYSHQLSHFFSCLRRGEPSWIVRKEHVIWTIEVLEKLAQGIKV